MSKTPKIIVAITLVFSLVLNNMSILSAAVIEEENQVAPSNQYIDNTIDNTDEDIVEDSTDDASLEKEEENADEPQISNTENTQQNESVVDKQEISLINTEINTIENKKAEAKTTGNLFLNIDLRFPQAETKLDVSLKKDNKSVGITPEFSKGEGNDTKLYYTFRDLEAGEYNLVISGKGYATFNQSVKIEKNTTSELSFTNGYDMLDLLSSNSQEVKNKFGIVQIGDVNNDQSVKENDVNELIDKIEGKESKSSYTYDLNADGEVNIIDLSYAAINKNRAINVAIPSCEANVDPELTQIDHEETTKVVGDADLGEILKNNDNYVSLQPAGGEEISETNPVEISLDMANQVVPTEVITIAPSINPENNIEEGTVVVNGTTTIGEEEKEKEIVCNIVRKDNQNINVKNNYAINSIAKLALSPILSSDPVKSEGTVTVNADGTIVVDLGSTVAVKKITIKVTGTKSNKLADIAKVEFLNGMSDKIPEPQLDIPQNLKAQVTEEQITMTWDDAVNVTGYEVLITSNGVSEKHLVDGHTLTIENFNNKAIKDQLKTNDKPTEYEIRVRSVNGEWFSGYSDSVTAIPTANGAPNKPTGISVVGAYKEIVVSWDKDPRADTYEVWYREKDIGEFKLATEGITGNSYRISNLNDKTKYQAYVIAVNIDPNTKEPRKSPQSIIGTAETTAVQRVKLPKRNLINTSKGQGSLTNHIVNVKFNPDGSRRFMVGSSLDTTSQTAYGIVDDSFFSFFQVNDWDLGGWYTGEKGPTVEFDQEYKMDTIAVAQAEWTGSLNYANVVYYDANGTRKECRASQVYTRQDEDGLNYTLIKLSDPISAKKISVNVGRANMANGKITIAEINFYYYDDLEDRINDLYEDQMHIKLKDNVQMSDIEALENEVLQIDEESGEYHIEKDKLLLEINEAKEIYVNGEKLCNTIKIDDSVTAYYDNHIEFKNSGMNAWQPLGVVAHAGDTVTVYVGNEYKDLGQSTNLQLIATQYHGYASNWSTTLVKNLKIGKNVVTIPENLKMDVEKGGSLYINYTGLKDDNPYKSFEKYYGVRVEGAHEIPVLDLTKVDDSKEAKMPVITEYVEKLENLMDTIADSHNEICIPAGESYGEKEYGTENNEVNCILGATEIVMDHMMYSVSAKQILEGLGEGTTEAKAEQLYNSIETMDDMIDLFYANKGLSELKEAGANNQYPRSRLNIRYMRMTGRAFMYAGGSHIGIEWPEVKSLSQGHQIVADENGKYISGNNFGWGIAHEIGHCINQQAYVHGEVTNNYFSILSQAKDTNDSVRFSYDEVYKKVTSGKVGKSQNVFTQLGLYWQLHLAYDNNGYNFKKYDSYKDILDSYVFARMDTYARDTSKAPKGKDNIALTLTSDDKDNNLMRLACAATQKNVLEFFVKWGMVPNEETIKYASQWPDEDRAIYYINDEARAYVLDGGAEMVEDTKVEASRKEGKNANQVEITLSNNHSAENKDAILGYEIIRTYMSNDEEKSSVAAFVPANGASDKITYTDTIDTLNNRVFTYKVIAYDKYLNKTDELVLEPIKISHDGTLGGKEDWTIDTNLTSELDKYVEEDAEYKADENEVLQKGIDKLIDKDYNTDYDGKKPADNDGEIILSLNGLKRIVGFKYTSNNEKTLQNYEVQVSNDGNNWSTVKKVESGIAQKIALMFNNGFDENHTQAVYFNKEDDDKLYMYDVSYVKFIIKDEDISISELDLIGQSGDNVELLENAIGILDEEVVLGTSDDTHEQVVIPKDSIIFTGKYKGNPAYNVVKLWDQDNKIVEGSQTFYAEPVKDGGELGEVNEGIWVYWIEPTIKDENGTDIENPVYKAFKEQNGKTVRAELYRVDNAQTLENERLTSDTYRTKVPDSLPKIRLNSNANIVE